MNLDQMAEVVQKAQDKNIPIAEIKIFDMAGKQIGKSYKSIYGSEFSGRDKSFSITSNKDNEVERTISIINGEEINSDLQNEEDGKLIKDGKYGLISDEGYPIVAPIYDQLYFLNDSLYIVYKQKKAGVINKYGKVIINFNYERFSQNYKNQIEGWDENHEYKTFDINGNEIIEYTSNYSIDKKNGKYGLMDNKGTVILPFKYDYLSFETPDLLFARTENNERELYVDINGIEYISE